MWLFIGTLGVAFLSSLMLIWLDDRIAESDETRLTLRAARRRGVIYIATAISPDVPPPSSAPLPRP